MITCPNCGKQTEGINHNGRGWRCTNCFARLPAKLEAEAQKNFEAKAKLRPEFIEGQEAAPVKPEYSLPYRSELKPQPEIEPSKQAEATQGNHPKRNKG